MYVLAYVFSVFDYLVEGQETIRRRMLGEFRAAFTMLLAVGGRDKCVRIIPALNAVVAKASHNIMYDTYTFSPFVSPDMSVLQHARCAEIQQRTVAFSRRAQLSVLRRALFLGYSDILRLHPGRTA